MNDLPDYREQAKRNKELFMETLKQAYPELHAVANLMDAVQFNPLILFHTIQHVSEIAKGTGFGQVHILIEDRTVRFVRGEHSTKLNEPVFKQDEL
jgi:hypothetical protein